MPEPLSTDQQSRVRVITESRLALTYRHTCNTCGEEWVA